MTALFSNYSRLPLRFVDGNGCYLTADDGTQYLDLVAGIAVNVLGHKNPTIIKAMEAAMRKPLHVTNLYEIAEQEELGAMLTGLAGKDYKAFFINSGTEANEAAMKLARKATGRTKLICFTGAFHGRTYGALSITPQKEKQHGFEPLVPDCHVLGFNSMDDLQQIDEQTAGVFVEPIQGEGGITVADAQWLQALEKRCNEVGALLIADEIQASMGRTGSFFAYTASGITPDVITLAKGLGGGLPIGAMLAKENVAASFTPGTHGTTFGGNPFVCAVSKAVVDTVSDAAFLQSVHDVSTLLWEELKTLQSQHPETITELRGTGLMVGIVCSSAEIAVSIREKLQKEHHILVNVTAGNVVRLVPALVIRKEEVEEFLEAFGKTLDRI